MMLNVGCTYIQRFAMHRIRIPLGVSDAWIWSRGKTKVEDRANPIIK
ncbi:hypothetical protein [Methyloprofundus sp.]